MVVKRQNIQFTIFSISKRTAQWHETYSHCHTAVSAIHQQDFLETSTLPPTPPHTHTQDFQGFPDSSIGKESACNAGDPGLIPGSGRSAREGIGYPLQYSWASLAAQLVKNLHAMQQIWVWSLGWEDPLEKGKATHSSILAWRILCTV